MWMNVPLECILVMIIHVLTVSTQREVMNVFVSQATLEMESLASTLVLIIALKLHVQPMARVSNG